MGRIDADLLIRYHQNACSDKERMLVEAWLRGEVSSEILDELKLSGQQEQTIGDEIWTTVQSTMEAERYASLLSVYKKAMRYAAVIVLPLLLWPIAESTTLLNRVVILDNFGSIHSRKYALSGLEVELGANSQCRLHIDLFGAVHEIDFDGAVSVTNAATNTSAIKVVSPAENCEAGALNDKVSLQAGESYMALVNADCRIVAATDRELREGLPIGVKLEIQKYFTL